MPESRLRRSSWTWEKSFLVLFGIAAWAVAVDTSEIIEIDLIDVMTIDALSHQSPLMVSSVSAVVGTITLAFGLFWPFD